MIPARWTQSLLHSLDRVAARSGWRDPRSQHSRFGERGEEEAYFHLRRIGYVIVARNYRSNRLRAELDLVGWEGKTLCFIEVKTRSARDFAPADAAVDPKKREDLRRIASDYIRHLPGVTAHLRNGRQADLPATRFDVISVYMLPDQAPEFELIKNAFDW